MASKLSAFLVELKALAVNDAVLVSIPAEVFVDVALAVKRRHAAAKVFVIGFADYVVGYVPTEEDFRDHGYANTGAPHYYNHPPFRRDVADIVTEKAIEVASQVVSPDC